MSNLTDRQRRQSEIWRNLTPEQRDYDRFVARRVPSHLPAWEKWAPETEFGRQFDAKRCSSDEQDLFEIGCTCMISPPCGFCTQLTEEEVDMLDNGATREEIRARREEVSQS